MGPYSAFGNEQHHIVDMPNYHISQHHESQDFLPEFLNILIHHNSNGTNGGVSNSIEEGQNHTESSSESLIVCAIVLPLLLVFGAIIFVAIIIRRMRLSEDECCDRQEDQVESGPRSIPTPTDIKSGGQINTIFNFTSENNISNSNEKENHQYEQNIQQNHNDTIELGNRRASNISSDKDKDKNHRKNKSIQVIGSRVFKTINFPKRLKERHAKRKRFNIYTIPIETREQLKQIYVY